MTDFANNPTKLVALCVLIAFVCLVMLWILHLISKRRLEEKHLLEEILAGNMTVNDARRFLGYPEAPGPLDLSVSESEVKYHYPAA